MGEWRTRTPRESGDGDPYQSSSSIGSSNGRKRREERDEEEEERKGGKRHRGTSRAEQKQRLMIAADRREAIARWDAEASGGGGEPTLSAVQRFLSRHKLMGIKECGTGRILEELEVREVLAYVKGLVMLLLMSPRLPPTAARKGGTDRRGHAARRTQGRTVGHDSDVSGAGG